MALELSEHTIETYDDFDVAGVAHRGPDVDAAELWAALDDYADDFDEAVVSERRFGVIYDFDERNEEFTYVAGYEVESADDLSPELTVVEIPEGEYAVFSLRGVGLDEMVQEIDERMLADSDYEVTDGAIVQRFDRAEDPTDPDAPFELVVPVEEE